MGAPAEHRGQSGDVVGVAGEDVMSEADGADDEVRVDDIGCLGSGEQAADGPTVIEGVDRDCLQESRKACLTRGVSPDLGDDRMCGVQRSSGDRSAAARNVWAVFSLRSIEMRKPASRITARIGQPSPRCPWSSIGPSWASQSATKERRASCRRRSAARIRRAWRMALDRPPYSGRACRGVLRLHRRVGPSWYSWHERSTVVLHFRRIFARARRDPNISVQRLCLDERRRPCMRVCTSGCARPSDT